MHVRMHMHVFEVSCVFLSSRSNKVQTKATRTTSFKLKKSAVQVEASLAKLYPSNRIILKGIGSDINDSREIHGPYVDSEPGTKMTDMVGVGCDTVTHHRVSSLSSQSMPVDRAEQGQKKQKRSNQHKPLREFLL